MHFLFWLLCSMSLPPLTIFPLNILLLIYFLCLFVKKNLEESLGIYAHPLDLQSYKGISLVPIPIDLPSYPNILLLLIMQTNLIDSMLRIASYEELLKYMNKKSRRIAKVFTMHFWVWPLCSMSLPTSNTTLDLLLSLFAKKNLAEFLGIYLLLLITQTGLIDPMQNLRIAYSTDWCVYKEE